MAKTPLHRKNKVLHRFSEAALVKGQFDGGRIQEIKALGFPGEGGAIERVGPLFYWAWATAKGPGLIALHPHRAFEIMSYVIEGEIGHKDTLGNRSRVGAGGAQVMQTGSGVSHEEETLSEGADFFQIWFEPYLEESVLKHPTYSEHHDSDFPVTQNEGIRVKTILGANSPVSLEVDAQMEDIEIPPQTQWKKEIGDRRAWVWAVVQGEAQFATDSESLPFVSREFGMLQAEESTPLTIQTESKGVRLVGVEVPTEVNYPLYPFRKKHK